MVVQHDLVTALEPLYILYKYLGFLSFNIEEYNGGRYFKEYRAHLVVAGIVQVVTFPGIVTMFVKQSNNIQANSIMETIFYTICYVLQTTCFLCSILASKVYNSEYLSAINKLKCIEKQLNIFKISICWRRTKLVSVIILIINTIPALIYAIFLTYTNIAFVSNITEFLYYLYVAYYELLAHSIVMSQFCTSYGIINGIMDRLNLCVTTNVQFLNGNEEFFIAASKMYHEVFECSRNLKKIFSLQILLEIGLTFASVVFYLFSFTSLWALRGFKENSIMIASIFATLTVISNSGMYILMAELFVKRVSCDI